MSKKTYMDFCNKYKIRCEKKKLFDKNLYRFIMDLPENEEDVINMETVWFRKNDENDMFEPYIYNYEEIEGRPYGEVVGEGDLIYDWIRYIKHSSRPYSAKKRKRIAGGLTPIQWVLSIEWFNNIVRCNSKVMPLAGTRQLGKTYLARKIIGFAPVFLPKYMDIRAERFWLTLCSYKKDSVSTKFDESKGDLEKAIKLHNELYPNTPLLEGKETKKFGRQFKNKENVMEIGMLVDGDLVPYSIINAISTSVTSDGLSSHLMVLDEPQYTPYEEYQKTEAFTAGTGGCMLLTGIGSNRADDTQTHYYNLKDNEDVEFNRVPFPIVYGVTKFIDPVDAEIKFSQFCSKAESWGGLQSLNVATHFLSRFDSMDGKFMTRQLLKRNKIQNIEYNPNKKPTGKYRVAGVDFASMQDYQTMVIFDVWYDEYEDIYSGVKEMIPHYDLVDVITFNKSKEKLDHEESGNQIAMFCRQYEIDMVNCDGTGTQAPYITMIIKALKRAGINTLVSAYSFAGSNKQIMMEFLENAFVKSSISLFNEVCEKTHLPYRFLIKEMIDLIKEKTPNNKNVQYKAPNGAGFSDDHVMAMALAVYTIENIEKMMRAGKYIEIEKLKYIPYLNKFKDDKLDVIDRTEFYKSLKTKWGFVL